jgi:hypothetical protein
MAIAAVAGLAASVGAVATSAVVFGLTGAYAAMAAFAIGAGLSMVSRALMPKPDLGQQMGGLSTTVREATAPRQILYGRARLGGNMVFLANSGSDNKYLHLVLTLASHECDGLEEVYFNDEKVWSGGSFLSDWGTYARINFYDGTQTTADSNLASESVYWTSNHKLLGITYAAIRLAWDQEKWPNGVPNFSFVIRGKKVYNPVTGITQWSNNPALCIRDYLLDQDYGLAEDASAINSAYMNDAIALCDESVDLSGGGSHSRYQLDGVINTENSRKANIEGMLTSMGGRLVFSGGQYFLQGAKYYTPTITIDESVMVGGISVKTKQSRRSLYNAVKGVFLSEENNYTLSDYPAQISSEYQLDDGDPEYLDMALPFTVNNVRAQRLAKIALLKSRQQTTIEVPVNMAGLKLKAGDFVNISSAKMGWSAKPFEIIDYAINVSQDGQIIVNLNCIETASSIYDWTSSDQIDYLIGGEIDLYDGTVVSAPTALSATDTTFISGDGTALPSILVSWTPSDDAFVSRYEIEYKKSTDTEYTVGTSSGSRYYINNVEPAATYNIRVRAFNTLEVASDYVTINKAVSGDTTAPGIPQSASISGGIGSITLSWVNPIDKDFSNVVVYRSDTSGGTFTAIATVGGGYGVAAEFTNGGLDDSTEYFYKLSSVDYSGNESGTTIELSATTDAPAQPPRASKGYVFYTTASASAPATPSASSYNYDTAVLTGLTSGWQKDPVTIDGSDGKYWAASYVVVEDSYGGSQTITFSSPFTSYNFDGLVTFTNLNNELADPNSTEITTIDGGLVKTGTLDVNLVNIAGTSSSGINIKSAATGSRMEIKSDKIEIYDGSTLRVKIGNLT